MKKQLFIKTFGCQMNEYDTEKIVDIIDNNESVSLVDSPETCRFDYPKYMLNKRKSRS
jgi:tRNA A37 methylthiotransferase MiaB